MLRLETATAADFAPHIETVFLLCAEAVDIPLTLIDAAARGRDNEHERPFSLLFTGPAQPPLPQRIYALSHPSLGVHDIFLVPISDNGQQRVYEAVFA